MPPERRVPGFVDKVRMSLSNLLKPKAYQGAFEATRYSVHRTRIDAPQPTDFRMEMTGATRREMVRLSRWLEKNNGLYKQMIRDTAIYSIGEGIGLQALGGDYEWQNLVEAEWEQECIRPEISGRFSMLECLYIICEALDRDGEIFAIKTKDKKGNPKFQIIESHRVETAPDAMSLPDIFDGIRFDKYGRPTFYYVKQGDGKYEPIRAASMIHIFDPEYASQSRAFPPHQHAINHMRDEMDLLSMEKVAVKDNARTSRILKVEDTRMDSGDLGLGQPIAEGNGSSPPTDPDALNRILGGVTAVLGNNESLVSYQSARPSSAFSGFIDHLRRDAVMGGLPYEFVADPTRAGGASVRLVVAKAGRFFSHRQSIIINRFLQDYFQFWLGLRIDRKEIPNARNWWKTEWVCCKSVTVDAGREGANERADLDMGRIPPSDDFQSRGYGFEKTIRKLARDHAFIQKVSKETGVPEEKLWRKSPTGGAGQQKPAANTIPEGALGVVMPGPDGQPQIVPIDQIVGQAAEELPGDPLTNSEPELAPPPKQPAVEPTSQMETSVDTLPKQNPGLSRNREQPFQR
jgi:capsid protein